MKHLLSLFLLLLQFPYIFAQEKLFELKELNDISKSASFIGNKKLIMVGETHGTNEVPGFVFQLIKALHQSDKQVQLGLEISDIYQKDINHFLAVGNKEFLKNSGIFKGQNDGRGSQAIAKLLADVGTLKNVSIFGFDNEEGFMADDSAFGLRSSKRDSIMAKNIYQNLKTDFITIVLIGDFHAQPGIKSKAELQIPGSTTAYFLKYKLGLAEDMLTLKAYANKGDAWNCQEDGCKVHPYSSGVQIADELKGKDFLYLYGKQQESGFDGLIYFDTYTSSPPLLR